MFQVVRILFVVVICSPALSAEEKPKPKGATATVFADSCVFHFPIANENNKWRWGISPAGQCEYSWMVTVKPGKEKYQIGFSYFNPTATPSSGSLSDLLFTGQANAWKLNDDEGLATYVEGLQVECTDAGNYLQIKIDDKKWTQKLFRDKPKLLIFETTGTQLNRRKHTVQVIYKPTAAKQDEAPATADKE